MIAWTLIVVSVISVVKCQYTYPSKGLGIADDRSGFDVFGRGYAREDINGDEIPGTVGRDYPVYAKVPNTGFRCDQQRFPGYYADPGSGCQAFHICQRNGRSDSFLCPNGTIFDQEWLVCDWWYNFDCGRAESLYFVNEQVVRAMEEADEPKEFQRFENTGRENFEGYDSARRFAGSGSYFANLQRNAIYKGVSSILAGPFSNPGPQNRRFSTHRDFSPSRLYLPGGN